MKTKKLLIAVIVICTLQSAKAQSIRVVYEGQPKVEIDGIDQSLAEQIKKNMKMKYMLCYNNGESIYKSVKNENSGGGIIVKTPDDVTYRNHNTKKEISHRDFWGKEFLIEDELKVDGNWTVVDSVKEIQGYLCTKAIGSSADGKEIAVWFCPNLPVSDGPVYTGLNGLVLEMQSGNITLVATEISDLADCEIAAPKKGKKTSKKDFDEMVKKRMEAMQREGNGVESGGDGNTITIKMK